MKGQKVIVTINADGSTSSVVEATSFLEIYNSRDSFEAKLLIPEAPFAEVYSQLYTELSNHCERCYACNLMTSPVSIAIEGEHVIVTMKTKGEFLESMNAMSSTEVKTMVGAFTGISLDSGAQEEKMVSSASSSLTPSIIEKEENLQIKADFNYTTYGLNYIPEDLYPVGKVFRNFFSASAFMGWVEYRTMGIATKHHKWEWLPEFNNRGIGTRLDNGMTYWEWLGQPIRCVLQAILTGAHGRALRRAYQYIMQLSESGSIGKFLNGGNQVHWLPKEFWKRAEFLDVNVFMICHAMLIYSVYPFTNAANAQYGMISIFLFVIENYDNGQINSLYLPSLLGSAETVRKVFICDARILLEKIRANEAKEFDHEAWTRALTGYGG